MSERLLENIGSEDDQQFFWIRVNRKSEKDCWIWQGTVNRGGNGEIKYKGKVYTSHRLAFLLTFPEQDTEENKSKIVVHRYFCNDILCCNPTHLCWKDDEENFQDYFWTQIDVKDDDTVCWEWKKSRNEDGYGRISYKGKILGTHRLAYFFMYPEKNTEENQKLSVLHTCDNPSCCNPLHLRLGTNKENIQDMVDKDRQAKGEDVGQAKLTEEQVKEILQLKNGNLSAKYIAAKFNVGKRQIHYIWRGDQWKHVSETEDNVIIKNCEECSQPFETIKQAEDVICCSHECNLLNKQKNIIIKKCQTCNKEFTVTQYQLEKGEGKHCSFACRNTHIEKKCVQCGKSFSVKQYRKDEAKYCSNKCRFIGAASPTSDRVIRTCLQCKKTFNVTQYTVDNDNGKFCSRNCFSVFRSNKIPKTCLICETIFYVTPSKAKFRPCETCSRECKALLNTKKNRVNKICGNCGKEFTAIKAFKDTKYCSNECYQSMRKGIKIIS